MIQMTIIAGGFNNAFLILHMNVLLNMMMRDYIPCVNITLVWMGILLGIVSILVITLRRVNVKAGSWWNARNVPVTISQ
jgi:hypothetical protein